MPQVALVIDMCLESAGMHLYQPQRPVPAKTVFLCPTVN